MAGKYEFAQIAFSALVKARSQFGHGVGPAAGLQLSVKVIDRQLKPKQSGRVRFELIVFVEPVDRGSKIVFPYPFFVAIRYRVLYLLVPRRLINSKSLIAIVSS